MCADLFDRISGCSTPEGARAFFAAVEHGIADELEVRALGVMRGLSDSGPGSQFPHLIVASVDRPVGEHPGTLCSLRQVVADVAGAGGGLGFVNSHEHFTALGYGHLWSYGISGRLQVEPPEVPPEYASDRSRLMFRPPGLDVFPLSAREVMRAVLGRIVPGPAKAFSIIDPRFPSIPAMTFNVFRDRFASQEQVANLRAILRWHVPIHIALNVFTTEDEVFELFQRDPGF